MIKITGCRILVKPFKIEEQDEVLRRAAAMGIKLPDADERKRQSLVEQGTVLQIGPGCDPAYVEGVKVGDVIGFAKFGGKFVKDLKTKEDFLVINDEDLVCIYKD